MKGEELLRTLRNGFVSGLIVVGPLVITYFVLSMLFGWLAASVDPFLALWLEEVGLIEDVIALLLLVAIITAIGIGFQRGSGDEVIARFDGFMERVPIVRTIYSPTRKASTALLKHGDQFERVVLVEWPREGVWMLGFVTDETPDHITTLLPGESHVDIYLPMSPNPMAGYLTMVPRSQVIETELSVAEGLRIVVTSGLYGDQEHGKRVSGSET